MHSNLITPPDFVESILILNATQEQIKLVTEKIELIDTCQNVYFYNEEMNAPEWLARVQQIVSITLDAKLTNPEDYFTK